MFKESFDNYTAKLINELKLKGFTHCAISSVEEKEFAIRVIKRSHTHTHCNLLAYIAKRVGQKSIISSMYANNINEIVQ